MEELELQIISHYQMDHVMLMLLLLLHQPSRIVFLLIHLQAVHFVDLLMLIKAEFVLTHMVQQFQLKPMDINKTL